MKLYHCLTALGFFLVANGFGTGNNLQRRRAQSSSSSSSTQLAAVDLSSVDTATLGIGAAVIAIGGIGGLVAINSGGGSGAAASTAAAAPEPEKIDVSIPYNAAALNAFHATGGNGDFAQFEQKYNAAAVEMVAAKKAARDTAAQMEAVAKKVKEAESAMNAVLSG